MSCHAPISGPRRCWHGHRKTSLFARTSDFQQQMTRTTGTAVTTISALDDIIATTANLRPNRAFVSQKWLNATKRLKATSNINMVS